MSTLTPLRQPPLAAPKQSPTRRPQAPQSRPRLVLVTKPQSNAARLPFLILVGAVLVIGLVGVLVLHMVAAQDAYRASTLQSKLGVLTDQEQRLSTLVERDSAPAALRQRARALGMVATTVGSFHKLHDGRAVGVQTPVYVAPPAPAATASAKPTPTTSASAKPGASAKPTAKQSPTTASRHGSPKHSKPPATQSTTKKTHKPPQSPTHHG